MAHGFFGILDLFDEGLLMNLIVLAFNFQLCVVDVILILIVSLLLWCIVPIISEKTP
jgi:hypothetical protein